MANLKFKVGGVWNQIVTIKGDKGDAGDALPVGGTAGQLLIKQSSLDNDATWQNNPTHDDRYYTETEVDTLLSGKAGSAHGHAISDVTGLQTALDGKVDDSQVLTNVPAGAVFTDTVYVHPATHAPSIIAQDASNRFVTDTEKATWNAKLSSVPNASTQVSSLGVGTAASGTAGEIRATNNITAYYSDARLKDFLGTIPNALDKVLALNGYYFVENEEAKLLGYDNDRVQLGVSAQEVQAVLPEAVTGAPIGGDYLTVWYEKLVPVLIEAIKEQQKQIDELKAKVM